MRLIDADALREDWLENGLNERAYDTNDFLSSIDDAPTVDFSPLLSEKELAAVHAALCHALCTIYKNDDERSEDVVSAYFALSAVCGVSEETTRYTLASGIAAFENYLEKVMDDA